MCCMGRREGLGAHELERSYGVTERVSEPPINDLDYLNRVVVGFNSKVKSLNV